jgi:cobalt-zinc-cadmium efflux system outer membrane protein
MMLNLRRNPNFKPSRCSAPIAIAAALALLATGSAFGQSAAPATQQTAPAPPVLQARVTLDRAIELALQHNHTLLATRTTIDQDRAAEITANLRPDPVLSWDAQFLPVFQPSLFSADYLNNNAQFDLGVSYLFERGQKRQFRLTAARAATAVTGATITDNERTLIFGVCQQFIGALLANANLELAQMDLASFQDTVQISESRYQAGDISQGDLLKIQLQLLQFQMDVNAARLAKVQALAALRQQVGFDALPEGYDVDGDLIYQPMPFQLDDLKAMALRTRPDLRAAQLGVAAAQGQYGLARAEGKRDLGAGFNYSHLGSANTGSLFFNIQLPIFDRNQGEIARTRVAITQAQETQAAQSEAVLTDVTNAYESLRSNDAIIKLYASGYLQQAQDSRDISQYAYERGAVSLLDYLDAERSYRATQLAYRQSLASYTLELEQLRQAVGTRSLP